MLRFRFVALAPFIAMASVPLAQAEAVWATNAHAYASLFSGPAEPVIKDVMQDTEAKVDILFAQSEAFAATAYASAFSSAQGSQTGAMTYTTHAFGRADTELNGLTSGRYRVSFSYLVLDGPNDLFFSNDAAVGFEYEGGKFEIKSGGAGAHTSELALDVGGKREDLWIAFYAWSDSHAIEGSAAGNARISDIVVERLPDQPVLVTPVPAAAWMFASALGALAVRRRVFGSSA